jgi:hypothetical protein
LFRKCKKVFLMTNYLTILFELYYSFISGCTFDANKLLEWQKVISKKICLRKFAHWTEEKFYPLAVLWSNKSSKQKNKKKRNFFDRFLLNTSVTWEIGNMPNGCENNCKLKVSGSKRFWMKWKKFNIINFQKILQVC